MITRITFGFILVLGFLTQLPVLAATDVNMDIESQRRAYRDALAALRSNQIWRYKLLLNDLDGYVLRGHLEFQYLKQHITSTPTETLREYLATNQHSVTSKYLRKRWLTHLARQGNWELFLSESKDIR